MLLLKIISADMNIHFVRFLRTVRPYLAMTFLYSIENSNLSGVFYRVRNLRGYHLNNK
jgi:hypothetical protein